MGTSRHCEKRSDEAIFFFNSCSKKIKKIQASVKNYSTDAFFFDIMT